MFLFLKQLLTWSCMHQLQFINICFVFWLVFWSICFCNSDVLFLICLHSSLCVRLQFYVLRLIWLLCCICDILLLAWLFKWILWYRLTCWFEFSFYSIFFLCAHFIIVENSLIYLTFKLILKVSWLFFLSEALFACWICMTCKIDE